MRNATVRRCMALCGYVSCLGLLSGPLAAQVGPIQPVLVLPDGKNELSHDRPELGQNYAVPVDVFVAASGAVTNVVVSQPSGNPTADALGADHVRGRKFLPALDARGKPVDGIVRVSVSMFNRGTKKVVKVLVKPPALAAETTRVKNMMCADFVWEMDRLRDAAHVYDPSFEVMPYTSAQIYVQQRVRSSEAQEKFWDSWPNTLDKIVARCEKAPEKLYYSEVLVPSLDGMMPSRELETAAASP